jgi:predicted AlkP superfamily pyrophosphatase or phosphodiesterase
MRIRSITHFVTAAFFLSLGVGRVWADVELAVVSTAPARAHFVAAGVATTFVVSAGNTSILPVTVSMKIQSSVGPPGDWQALLFAADNLFRPVGSGSDQMVVTIPPRQTVRIVARLGAGPSLADGAEGGAVVSAWLQGSLQGSLELKTRVRNRPKVYYVAFDGCGRGYLDLNRKGTWFDGTGERLMPRAWAFASRGARMNNASSVLPAVTDPNHAAALTGSWAGTLGIFSVRTQYMGEDAAGRPVMAGDSRDMLRWGPDGQRVPAVFDVNKDPASGGSPTAFNAIISGKNWLGELFRDGAMDLVVNGKDYPAYVPAPQPYRLGDPPSDDNSQQDREGTNLGPWGLKHLFSAEAALIGTLPWDFPEDHWIAEATVRVIQAEDPDVLYVDLAGPDEVQHVFGAADRPEEWVDPGTPNILWDDENVYNENANRDPVLDVVHEADWDFGLITDTLDARQALSHSFVVLLSDHGLTTAMNAPGTLLDPGKILLDNGFTDSDVERIVNRGDIAHIDLRDPTMSGRIEAALESYEVFDPVAKTKVRPFVVINRDEMDSGIDGIGGALAKDGVAGNRRGELYSEWNIDMASTDNTKIKWPDLFIFMRDHFRTKISTKLSSSSDGPPLNGVHGSRSSAEVILIMSGLGIQPGVYARPASLADIAPTLYRLLGVNAPGNVDGRILDEILSH